MEEVVGKVRNNLTSSVKEALDPTTLSQAQPNTGRKSNAGLISANDVFRSYRCVFSYCPRSAWSKGAKISGCDAARKFDIHIVANSAVSIILSRFL